MKYSRVICQEKKHLLSKFLILIAFSFLISSCNTLNVATDSKIQKRKYTKGFYVRNDGASIKTVARKNQEVKADTKKKSADIFKMISSQDSNVFIASKELNIGLIVNLSKRYGFFNINQPNKKNASAENHTDSDLKDHKNTERVTRSHSAQLPEKNNNISSQSQRGIFGVLGFILSLLGLVLIFSGIVGMILCASEVFSGSTDAFSRADGWSIAGFILGVVDVVGWALLLAFLFVSGFITAGLIILIASVVLSALAVLLLWLLR
jgi:hypothetical protein